MASLLHHNSGVLIPRDEYEALTEALATVLRIGSHFTPRLIERLDDMDGDADSEPGGDDEPVAAEGDSGDCAFVEWISKPGNLRRRGGPELIVGHEDDENDDPAEEDDPSGQCDEDGINTTLHAQRGDGPGCLIADSDSEVDDI